jgi:thiol-disulfide isomerase/thioredoxin
MINKLITNYLIAYTSTKQYSKHFCLIIIYLLISTNVFALEQIKSGVKILDGSSAPDSIIFFDDEGNKYSLDKFEGKTILLVFWATWCSACTHEMVNLDVLQKDFRKLPFVVVPVSQDYQGIEVIKKYYKNNDIRYLPIYHDFKNQLFKAFAIVGIPTAILIDQDGKMLISFVGNINWYDEAIRSLLVSKIPGNHLEPKNSYQGQPLNQTVNVPPKSEAREDKNVAPSEIINKQ